MLIKKNQYSSSRCYFLLAVTWDELMVKKFTLAITTAKMKFETSLFNTLAIILHKCSLFFWWQHWWKKLCGNEDYYRSLLVYDRMW